MPAPRLLLAALLAALLATVVASAPARAATPIPEDPRAASAAPSFVGKPASADPVSAPLAPRHPHMAPNGSSNIHVDAWQTDANAGAGPLGRDLQRTSTSQSGECASVAFDSRGRIVTICIGPQGPSGPTTGLVMMDPRTLDTLAHYSLPPRRPSASANVTSDFGGGGYF